MNACHGRKGPACNPDTARAIVNLLLNDPGVASLEGRVAFEHSPPSVAVCKGCGEKFTPSAFGRQYCARSCYDATLERKRDGKREGKQPKKRRPGTIGTGGRIPTAVLEYVAKVRDEGFVDVDQVRDQVESRFGVRLGVTTVYRVWRKASVRA